LPASLFAKCTQVENINLYNNPLKELPDTLFANCVQLRNVDCSNISISEIIYSVPKLDDLVIFRHSGIKFEKYYPKEFAHIKKYRRVADDPRSYAWDIRKYVLLGMEFGID
jgi:hypothetical protein